MVDLAAEYEEVGAAVEAAALRVLRSQRYLLGPETAAFEAEMAALIGVREAVAVGSGTQALVLALRACDVGAGDEVLTSPFTFFATIEAILGVGAIPVFADIEAGGFNISPHSLEPLLTGRTRAVIPVHLFGLCADMPPIAAFADAHGLVVIEDAAQAVGAARGGRPVGAWGRAAGFSFHPSKNLGAAGDAGCVTTDDSDLSERLRRLRNHGQDSGGPHLLAGTTARIDEIQAAVLRAKLPYLKQWNDRRARNAGHYLRLLAECPDVTLPVVAPEATAVWNQFSLRSQRADTIRRSLTEAGIESRHYYPRPVYREPAFAGLGGSACDVPCAEAERACAEAVSLPVHAGLSTDEIARVAEVVRAALTAG